ncbi:MAG: glycosyltransferase family 2 protein [Eubacteriales bacterium]|nr:glycosyltransferase family 2 protein [Eubacteriales bacterium]
MKTIIYSKFSNERSREFSIRTDILKAEDGTKTVRKSACFPEGKSHVARIAEWSARLAELFEGSAVCVNAGELLEDGSVELEFLEETSTLEEKLYYLWHGGKQEEALTILEDYVKFLRSRADVPFEMTEQFCRVFGNAKLPEGLMSLSVTDIDMVAGNLLLTKNGAWNLIDYEWTFDFPIPVNFVVYRIWHYFLNRNVGTETRFFEVYYQKAGISSAELVQYEAMERAFQSYVTGNYIPIRELYQKITPGCVEPEALRRQEKAQRDGELLSVLYYGDVEKEDRSTSVVSPVDLKENGEFTVEFSLAEASEAKKQKKLRWNVVTGKVCRVRNLSVNAAALVRIQPANSFHENGEDIFWSYDPVCFLEGDFSQADTIRITGEVHVLETVDIPEVVVKIRKERDALRDELTAVSQKLAATQSTKGYCMLERARRARNFTKARLGLLKPAQQPKNPYHYWYEKHCASAEELQLFRNSSFPYMPKISILVPTYRTPVPFLREMIESVQAQTYPNWELCIADGGSGPEIEKILDDYAAADSRIKYTVLKENGGISANTNGAAGLAAGDYIALLDHDDIIAPEALSEVAAALQDPLVEVVYTDEDKITMDSSEHFSPNFKPDFAPDLLRSHNYITHFLVIRKTLFDEVGGFCSEYDGAQDYDLIFKCTEKAKKIYHIPRVLYHWRAHKDSTAENPESKLYAYEAGRKAIDAHLGRCGLKGSAERMKLWGMYHVTYETPGDPLVSIVIPNKDHTEDLDRCIRSVLERSSYRNLEIVVVENNSTEKETFAYYERIQKEFSEVRVERWEREFNYSAINNFGAARAKGNYLLFLNNDTELVEADSIREMLGYCMRPGTGCVGAKLLYGDGTIQHAGIVLGFGGFAGHVFTGKAGDDLGYMMRAAITGNYSAVTAACLMVSRKVYEEVGGFPEDFPVALNDVDFCMKVRAAGHLIVYTPFSRWHHYESKTRGYEDTPEKEKRFQGEIARFRERWGAVVDAGDPYYNPNLAIDKEPFSLK